MKVLFITHCTAMAGANRSMFQLILELRDDYGVEPFVLLPFEYGSERELKDYLQETKIEYKECNVTYFKTNSRSYLARMTYYRSFYELKALCKSLRTMHFDIVHSNSSVIDFGGYISKEIGAKHVWHLRDFGDLDYDLYSIWGRQYEKATYNNGDAFIAISDAVKKHFQGTIDSSKICTIYNGIKPKENTKLSKHDNEFIQFFCAGVVCDAKNQIEIVKAVNLLVNDRNVCNLHLTIVGWGGDGYLELLKGYTHENRLEKYVTFLGVVDGIEQLASTMDVGIMSSKCEAFGRVTVEYMLQNLAVIANDNGANTEIVKDGETGLIYEHDNIAALADKMQMLIEDKNLLKALAVAGYNEAKERFLSSKNTKQIYDVYQELMNMPKSQVTNVMKLKSFWIMKLLRPLDYYPYIKNGLAFRYRRKYIPGYKRKINPTDCICSLDESSDLIYNLLMKDSPCMVSRFGSTELDCLINYRNFSHPFAFLRNIYPFWVSPNISSTMSNNAGFFSTGHKMYSRFADLMMDSAKQIDILGTWIETESVIEKRMSYTKTRLIFLNPFFASHPWSKALEGKRVLVVHPFAETIKKQYEKRELLFENKDVLPEFKSLTVIKSVQSIGGENGGFATWFDALHFMENQIDSVDYDIALIGCGAYGMPLAAHCKKMGKKAVHLGGVLQLLFGIRGRRWETEYDDNYKKLLSNPNWVRPSEDEKPKAAKDVENGCYW